MKTITAVRNAFWEQHENFKSEFRKTWRQNQYRTDIRVAFTEYVDYLQRDEQISDSLAQRVTL